MQKKLTQRNFIKYHTQACDIAFHKISNEKQIKFWEIFWRDILTDKDQRIELGKTLLNKLVPNQISHDGTLIDKSVQYTLQVVKIVQPSDATVPSTRKPDDRMGRPKSLPGTRCGS